MSIPSPTYSSLLATALMTPLLCCSVPANAAVHWSTGSNGYTVECELAVLNAPAGQWNQIQANFTALSGAKLSYKCTDNQSKGVTGGVESYEYYKFGFDCELVEEVHGSEVYIWHNMNTCKIEGLQPGLATQAQACEKVFNASQAQVKKLGTAP